MTCVFRTITGAQKKYKSMCPLCLTLFTDKVNLFAGFNITYRIKDGECKRVCCDGAGGPVKMIPTCKPPSDDSRCTEEKEEDNHCPGEPNGLCTNTCGSRSEHCASFALVGLLAIAAFFK